MDHVSRRARALNAAQRKSIDKSQSYVLYWCQASHRAEHNPAFEYACRRANELDRPLLVAFFLTPTYPEASERHYAFLLEGLLDAKAQFESRGAYFFARLHPDPPTAAIELSRRACVSIVDGAYLRLLRDWRARLAAGSPQLVIEVESDVCVPVRLVSPREEPSTALLRVKLQPFLPEFLRLIQPETQLRRRRDSGAEASSSDSDSSFPVAMDWDAVPDGYGTPLPLERGVAYILAHVLGEMDRSVQPVSWLYEGGTQEAKRRLEAFLTGGFSDYCDRAIRDNPALRKTSALSPYLHYGQISPVYVAVRVQEFVAGASLGAAPGRAARLKRCEEKYLNELIMWRESCYNFTFYNPNYDRWEGLPQWARDSLTEHEGDVRPYLYTERELELALTHDPHWNACQLQMTREGKMAPYMRMYWAKQILAWSPTPREALRIALKFNNKYEIDGRGPNAFAGVMWCFGLKDKEFEDRPVWGRIRPMGSAGLLGKIKGLRDYIARFPSDTAAIAAAAGRLGGAGVTNAKGDASRLDSETQSIPRTSSTDIASPASVLTGAGPGPGSAGHKRSAPVSVQKTLFELLGRRRAAGARGPGGDRADAEDIDGAEPPDESLS